MAAAPSFRLELVTMSAGNHSDFFHAGDSGGSHCRILLVDHDPYACHLSADALIRHGYEVNAAEDGDAGWEELQANHYHLLITEHNLPKFSGIKLVRKVRAARLALRVVMIASRIPVHQLTGKRSLQLEAMLLKPLSVDALLDTVRLVLRANVSSPGQVAPLPRPRNEPGVPPQCGQGQPLRNRLPR